MQAELTPAQAAYREEIQAYFRQMMTPELLDEIRGSEGGGPRYTAALRQMGSDGLLGVGWPEEFGGQDRSPIEQYIFADEVQRAGFPLPFLTLGTVGPSLMKFGDDEQRKYFLPKILAGELQFCIGYSEPDAGTDLASLKTRAVKDGGEWVINGQKVFTSLAHFADYVWLAARTDPDAPKHKGISIFCVPTSSPGFKLVPMPTMSGVTTNATFFEDVRVPASALIGGENQGWSLIVNQLNHERLSLVTPGPVEQLYEDTVAWARETKLQDGSRVLDLAWVQHNLALVKVKLDALKLMCWKQAWAMTQGSLHPADASACKVFGSESFIEIFDLLMEVIGPESAAHYQQPSAALSGKLSMRYSASLILTFGGGTNEVQRDIIAMAGLGLPHYKD